MSYKLIYTIPFASVTNVPMLLEVLKDGYEGEPTELIGGATPFTVSIDDEDFLYTPLRFSTGRLKLVGSDYLQNIYSTDYQQYKVNLKRNEVIVWTGYIKPEVYTQDYSSVLFELDVECVSAMSTLEFIDYKKSGDKYIFVSLFDLIKQCVSASGGNYGSIYIPHTYGKDKSNFDSWANVLAEMTISEQNFFDEEEKPMKLKEVLEEVCKFLNWTCVDFEGSLYFVDVDHIGEYYKYTPDFASYTKGSINTKNVQNIGFSGSGHTLDILGGYNKVSVKDSNYSISELFPEEDFDKLSIFARVADVVDGNKVETKIYLSPEVYRLYQYKNETGVPELPESELNEYKSSPYELLGAFPIRRCNYEMNRNDDGSFTPSIDEYKWDHMIQVRRRSGSNIIGWNNILLGFKRKLPLVAFYEGAISISCQMQIGRDLSVNDNKLSEPSFDPVIRCKLRIGDLFYSGAKKDWINSDSYFDLRFNKGSIKGGGFVTNNNTKTLQLEYSGLSGFIMELPGKLLMGDIEFQMFGANLYSDVGLGYYPAAYFVKDLKLTYKRWDGYADVDSDSDNDRIYENIVSDKYIRELDNIDFKITSYSGDGLSYSKIAFGKTLLTNNLYSAITNSNERPEELLIKRIINQYKATKIKLTQILKYDAEISPLTVMYDNYMVNKKFTITGGDIDYKNESFTVKMIEKK